ncbi:MAG: hypothetical protein GEU99_21130 [Luteitalea sp.]|nr:hypothetical protein [Luteitalea sp.]
MDRRTFLAWSTHLAALSATALIPPDLPHAAAWAGLRPRLRRSSSPAAIPRVDARVVNLPHKDTHFTMPVTGSLSDWQVRAAHLRRQILCAAGLYPMPEKTRLNPQIFGRIDRADYSVEKVYIETLPRYYLCGNLYRPRGRTGPFPGVLSPHGHWHYGRLEHTSLVSVPARCINLARQGYVVFSYDMVGYTDTLQTPHAFGDEEEQLWSFGPFALQLWNSIRSVDFLQSLPDVDEQRIAVTGASGGGTQTFFLAAVDDRVTCAAPVVMISAIMQGGSPCENAPGLRLGTFNVEIAATIAPRPMLIVSATGDRTKSTPEVEFPAIRSIYALYGKASLVETVQVDAPHNYNQQAREAVYRFFGKHMLGDHDPANFAERPGRPEHLRNMLVWSGRSLPEKALSFEGVRNAWIEMGAGQTARIVERELVKERLVLVLAAEWPRRVISGVEGHQLVLSREGRGDRVVCLRVGDGVPDTIVVHDGGAEEASKSTEVDALVRSRRAVLLVTAFRTDTSVPPRPTTRYFTTFNKTDDAERVQDILTAIAFLRQQGAKDVRVTGLGKAAVWTLFAAAVAKAPVRWTGDLGRFTGSDRDFVGSFFVPGIQRIGGLKAALALVQ